METPTGHPITRRRVRDDQKREENAKRRKALLQEATIPEMNDVVVINAEIKQEQIQIKTEPESEDISWHTDELPVMVKDEMELVVDEPESHISGDYLDQESLAYHHQCPCSVEIEMMKAELEQQNKDRSREFEKLKQEMRNELKERDGVIYALKKQIETLEQVVASKEINHLNDNGSRNTSGEFNDKSVQCENSGPDEATQGQIEETFDDRVTNLFGKVMEILWFKHVKTKTVSAKYMILNCRLVCKSWRRGTNSLLTKTGGPFSTKVIQCAPIRTNPNEINWVACWNVVSKYYPCPPTTLIICDKSLCGSVKTLAKFRLAVTEFLERFGNGIETLSYKMSYMKTKDFRTLKDWYATFRRWLELVPDLKVLKLQEKVERNASVEKVSRSPLTKLIKTNPIPHLKNLAEFHVSGNGYSEFLILSIFTRNESIKLGEWAYCPNAPEEPNADWAYSHIRPGIGTPFPPNMESFRIKMSSDIDLLTLCSLGSAPLLNLEVKISVTKLRDKMSETFRLISTFQNLKELKVTYSCNVTAMPLIIPSPEKLTLVTKDWSGIDPMDTQIRRFISPLSSLQTLSIENFQLECLGWFHKFEDGECVTYTQLRKSVELHFVGKLWNMLPALRQVRMSCSQPHGKHPFVFQRQP